MSLMSEDYLKAAVEIAREAGAILREEFDRPLQITYKGDADLVTQADRRSERSSDTNRKRRLASRIARRNG